MTKQEQTHKAHKKPRTRKCLTCKQWFKPKEQGITTCSTDCAILHGKSNFSKQKKREHAKDKKAHYENDVKWMTKEAQKTVNGYIRKRDEHKPCISCGYVFSYLEGEPQGEGRQRQAGHLKPEAKNSLLRFDEDNIHAQCNHCNDPIWGLKGNVAEYEKNLRRRIGDERVDRLFQPKKVKKWTISELREIIEKYKQKTRELNEL